MLISASQAWYSLCMTFVTFGLFLYWGNKFKNKFSFKNKVVFITGACAKGGLGINIAALVKTLGAKVIIVTSRSEKSGLDGMQFLECVEGDGHVVHVTLDLNWSSDKIRNLVEELWSRFKKIDVVIANAGMSYRGEVISTSDEVFKQLMQSNFTGNVTLLNSFAKLMTSNETDEDGYYIAGISSIQGRISIPYRSAYSASKHAFTAYLDCLRAELSGNNKPIKVLCVHPSYIKTNLSLNAVRDSGDKHGKLDETTAKGMDPEIAASYITASIRRGEEELNLLDLKSRLALLIRTLLPWLYFYIMRKRARHSKPY